MHPHSTVWPCCADLPRTTGSPWDVCSLYASWHPIQGVALHATYEVGMCRWLAVIISSQRVVECNCANEHLGSVHSWDKAPSISCVPQKAKIHGSWYELWTPHSAIAFSRMWSSAWAVWKAAYRLPDPTIFRVQKESYEILLPARDHQ